MITQTKEKACPVCKKDRVCPICKNVGTCQRTVDKDYYGNHREEVVCLVCKQRLYFFRRDMYGNTEEIDLD